jgi:hypothetical protein
VSNPHLHDIFQFRQCWWHQIPSRVEKLFGQLVDDALTAFARVAERTGVSAQRLVLDVVALSWYPFAHEHTLLPALGMSPRDPKFLQDHKQHVIRIVLALARGD